MPRAQDRRTVDLDSLMQTLCTTGPGTPDLAARLAALEALRREAAGTGPAIDRALVEALARLHQGLAEAEGAQRKLRALHAALTAPPWHPAIFLGTATTARGPGAMVMYNGVRRIVAIAEETAVANVAVGDEVLLGHELNAVVAPSPFRGTPVGETASYDRTLADGRLVLRARDEPVVVDAIEPLRRTELRHGDEIRFDRRLWMAFERVERSRETHHFLEAVPTETFADVGGLDGQIAAIKRAVLLHLNHASLATRYGLARPRSLLLVGPPGSGKTMLARALCHWLADIAPGHPRFINVKPSALHSMWYGQSEQNYRAVFHAAREAAQQTPGVPVVLFFDELDAVAATRGESHHRVDDRILNAFMTELDGLEARGNVLVVGATNRLEALDPAMLREGRFGDCTIEVPRPSRTAGRDILTRVFPPGLPYAPDGQGGEATRATILDAALARLYAPNGEGTLATLILRDASRRTVGARDLVSGARLAKIARTAKERACLREIDAGGAGHGLRLDDVLTAIEDELWSAVRVLTPGNCRQHLDGLAPDALVVGVEVAERRVRRPHRYLTAV